MEDINTEVQIFKNVIEVLEDVIDAAYEGVEYEVRETKPDGDRVYEILYSGLGKFTVTINPPDKLGDARHSDAVCDNMIVLLGDMLPSLVELVSKYKEMNSEKVALVHSLAIASKIASESLLAMDRNGWQELKSKGEISDEV